MTLRPCARETELRTHLESGHWPQACPAELREHAATCSSCSRLILLTQAFRSERATATAAAQLPPPGLIWWRAQLRRRNAAVERITRPLFGAQIFAISLIASIAVVLLITQASSGIHWLSELAQSPAVHALTSFNSSPNTSAPHDSTSATTFSAIIAAWNLPLILPAFTVLLLLAGAVVYLTSEKS